VNPITGGFSSQFRNAGSAWTGEEGQFGHSVNQWSLYTLHGHSVSGMVNSDHSKLLGATEISDKRLFLENRKWSCWNRVPFITRALLYSTGFSFTAALLSYWYGKCHTKIVLLA
jgi:hypothetical protein